MKKIVFLFFIFLKSLFSSDCGLVPYLDVSGHFIDGYYWVDCPSDGTPSGTSGLDSPALSPETASFPARGGGTSDVKNDIYTPAQVQAFFDFLYPLASNICSNDYLLFSPSTGFYSQLCHTPFGASRPTFPKSYISRQSSTFHILLPSRYSSLNLKTTGYSTYLSSTQMTVSISGYSVVESPSFVSSSVSSDGKTTTNTYSTYSNSISLYFEPSSFWSESDLIFLSNYYDSGPLCSFTFCSDYRLFKPYVPCPDGFIRNGAECVSKCSQNETWDTATSSCGCISGTNKMPSGLCSDCPVGQDSDVAGNCLPACPSGWHSQLVGNGSNICVQDGYTSGSTSSGSVAVRELDPAVYSGGGSFVYNPDGSGTFVNSSGQVTQNCDTSGMCTPVTNTSPSIYVASTGLVVGGFLVTAAGALTVPLDTPISTPVIAAGLGMIYSGLGIAGYTFYQDTMGNPVNPSSTAEKTFVMDISNFNTGASGGSSGSPSSGSVMGTSGDVTTYSTTGSNGSRMIVQVNSQTGEVVGFATKANSDEIEKVVHFNAAPNDPNNLAPDTSKVIDPIVVTPSAGSTSTGTVTWVWPDGTVDSYTFEPQTNTYTKSPVSSTNNDSGTTSGGSTSGGSTSGGTTSGGSTSGGTTSGGSTSGGSTSGGTTSGGSTSGGTSSGTGTSTGAGTSSGTGTTDGSGTSTGTGTGSGGSMGDGQTSGAAGTDTGSGDTTAGNSDFGSGFGDFDSFPNWQDFTDKLKSFTDDAKNKFSSVGQSVADAKDAMKNGIETKPISSGSGCNLYISTKFGSADLANSIDRVAVVFNPVITVLLTILFMWLQIMFFIKVYMFKGNS